MPRSKGFIAGSVIALLLAGCTGSPDPASAEADEADLEIRVPAGAFDQASGGPWYVWDGPTQAPATIRVVNDDDAWHRILVLPAAAQAPPAWAADDHADGQAGGGGHDHAAMLASGPLVDFGINASEAVTIRIEGAGLFTLHCHPHPWMEAVLDVRGPDRVFAVQPDFVERELLADGITNEGETAEVPIQVNGPNLVQFAATVRWDDSEDDPPFGGEALNAPDTIRVNLVAPDGSVVASKESTKRAGTLDVSFDEDLAWPDSINAPSTAHAVAALPEQVPDNGTWTGTWKLSVHVVAAPGTVLDEAAGASDDVDDGVQSWDATIVIKQAWAKVTT